jgi:protein kinase C substrate 80K-H
LRETTMRLIRVSWTLVQYPLTDAVYMLEEYLPASLRIWVREKLSELRKYLVENGVLAAAEETDEAESKALQDARSRVDSVRSMRDTRKADLDTSEEDLGKDYGPDDVFRSLKGQCVEVESGEYKYEFCFMGQATQKPQRGGMDTNMGNFERIETIIVDEELPADGKGLGSGERLALTYENGAHCWNGPARSTMVILACAEKNEIWKVVEAEKCVYRMEAGSPAACYEALAAGKADNGGKDEL